MYIQNRNVLHVVDKVSHFQSASLMTNMTAGETWKFQMRFRSKVNLGSPGHLRIDKYFNSFAKEFKGAAEACEIQNILDYLIGMPSTVSHAERYQGLLRVAYQKTERDFAR